LKIEGAFEKSLAGCASQANEGAMAFWSGAKLKTTLRERRLVTHFDEGRVDCAAYTLRMGRQYYLSASEDTSPQNKIEQLESGESVAIPAGQFAFLLTEELVTVPAGVIAFISMKTELKFRGLVNVSGFHVDPGFSGPLKFAVFNAGPSTVCVKQGEDCFLIWYADLDSEDTENIKTGENNKVYAMGISTRDVAAISGAVKTLNVIAGKVDQLEKTQSWMKVALYGLSFVAIIVTGMTLFLAQEGVRSLLSKAAAWLSMQV
jgi:dCTP deaminase